MGVGNNTHSEQLYILDGHPLPIAAKKWGVLFVTGESTKHKPKACSNCHMLWKKQERCAIHGPNIIIKPLTHNGDLHTPVCGLHDAGKPMVSDKPMYPSENNPEYSGLEWVEGKGTNCGGKNGGRMCVEHYDEESGEGNGSGFCRQLQDTVGGTDCCASNEGPGMNWRDAQKILKSGRS